MNSTKTITCKACDHCKTLYRHFGYYYLQNQAYYCDFRDEILDEDIACECWQRRVKKFDFSAQRFDKVEEDIRSLIEFFKNSKI